MAIQLFDVNCGFGGATPGQPSVLEAADLAAELQRVEIRKAIARIVPDDLDIDALASNAALYKACDEHPGLMPCPIVLPSGGGDLPSEEEQVLGHLRRGCRAVWLRPDRDYWLLAPWNCDALFRALAHHNLPVLLPESKFSLENAPDLASRYPSLPLVLLGASYRYQRALTPLLQTFPRVYLALGGSYAVHGAIEHLVSTVGARRVLFGTGFPPAEPMAAVTYLMYADISDEEKAMIGSANTERLISEVRR